MCICVFHYTDKVSCRGILRCVKTHKRPFKFSQNKKNDSFVPFNSHFYPKWLTIINWQALLRSNAMVMVRFEPATFWLLFMYFDHYLSPSFYFTTVSFAHFSKLVTNSFPCHSVENTLVRVWSNSSLICADEYIYNPHTSLEIFSPRIWCGSVSCILSVFTLLVLLSYCNFSNIAC